MKTIVVTAVFLLFINPLISQTAKIPSVLVKNPDGNDVSTEKIFEPGNYILVVFWKSNSNKCCENIESLQSAWVEKLKDKGLKMIAFCEDCNGSWGQVKPIINAKLWSFETFIDVNGDFKRSMGVHAIPTTILLDKNLKQLCRYNGFCSGSGELICEKIEKFIE